ncbi:MAG: hypothetical protein JJ975_14025 [Bacteroidia bacterium]|nr:hypothetical protein [Bacteroidia bacterium]
MRKLVYIIAILGLVGCKGSDPEVGNPYNNQDVGQEHDKVGADNKELDPNTIQGIHANVFKPTCANSGCHDGNFEPDFRTIEASYNTLVNQPIIKNDEMNPLTARVTPGNATTSMLMRRMLVDLNGNSGKMPIVVEPGSDWPTKKDEYIANIETWINNGALDQHGNAPTLTDFPVQLRGIAARVNGNVVGRNGAYGPMNVSKSGGTVELWFAFEDDAKSPDQLSGTSLDLSLNANVFDSTHLTAITYSASPLVAVGYFGEEENYHHKAVVNLTDWQVDDVVWIRTRVSDGVNKSEIPNNNSLFRAKQYATFRVK